MITRERPVEREIVKKEIKKEEGIKETPPKKIKIKIRSRIKNNLINLIKKTFYPDHISARLRKKSKCYKYLKFNHRHSDSDTSYKNNS